MAAFATRRTLATLLSRSLSTPCRSRLSLPLLNIQYQEQRPASNPFNVPARNKTSGYSPLNDPSPNWSNRPPKETILLDGCDYEHWLIVMEFSNDPKPSEEEMINAYVKTLAAVVGRYNSHFLHFFYCEIRDNFFAQSLLRLRFYLMPWHLASFFNGVVNVLNLNSALSNC